MWKWRDIPIIQNKVKSGILFIFVINNIYLSEALVFKNIPTHSLALGLSQGKLLTIIKFNPNKVHQVNFSLIQ